MADRPNGMSPCSSSGSEIAINSWHTSAFTASEEDPMEYVMAELLKDYEDGRVSRRQLLRNLAMAAAAVPMAGLLQTPAQAPAPAVYPKSTAIWKTMYVDHISYQVTDYKKSTQFYQDLMGWEVRNDNGNNQCELDMGSAGGIIIRNGRRPAAPATAPAAGATAAAPAPANARPAPVPVTSVIDHISFGIEPWDTDRVKAELDRRGLNPRPDNVGADFRSFHVKDPDGWDLQISNVVKKKA
jgi:catechol 2,3-dioxygenase-like lactoylglutathione lyase family enzyme